MWLNRSGPIQREKIVPRAPLYAPDFKYNFYHKPICIRCYFRSKVIDLLSIDMYIELESCPKIIIMFMYD